MMPIAPPTNYAQWLVVLDMLRDKVDDEAVFAAMQMGRLEWQAGVAERFSQKLTDVINARMDAAADRFSRTVSNARGEERIIVSAIIGLRKEMSFLAKAIAVPVIPEDHRAEYVRLVRSQADSMQSSLEDSARRDRSGKLASIVRNNKVNSF